MPLLARRSRRPELNPAQQIRDRYIAFLPYVLPKITVVQPSLVPDGYNAGVVAAHSETLRAALDVPSDHGRIRSAWLALAPHRREALSRELFGACLERARKQGYPIDDAAKLAGSESVRLAPVRLPEPVDATR